MAVERRGDAPDSALARAKLGLLLRRILVQPVGRIRHHGMQAVVLLLFQPIKTIRMEKFSPSKTLRLTPFLGMRKFSLHASISAILNGIQTAAFADESTRSIEPQIGTDRRSWRWPNHPADALRDLLHRKWLRSMRQHLKNGVPNMPRTITGLLCFHGSKIRRPDVFRQGRSRKNAISSARRRP